MYIFAANYCYAIKEIKRYNIVLSMVPFGGAPLFVVRWNKPPLLRDIQLILHSLEVLPGSWDAIFSQIVDCRLINFLLDSLLPRSWSVRKPRSLLQCLTITLWRLVGHCFASSIISICITFNQVSTRLPITVSKERLLLVGSFTPKYHTCYNFQ